MSDKSCCSDDPEHDRDHNHTHDHNHDHDHDRGNEFNLRRELMLIGSVVGLLTLGSIYESRLHQSIYAPVEYLIFIPAYLISGWTVLTTAGKNILRGQIFDENFLMAIATLGAIAIHQLPEAVSVMLFFQVGELFQSYAVGKTRNSIRSLLEVRPDRANLIIGNGIEIVSPEQVKIGDKILIKPGEKIPLDGKVIDGNSAIDTSALTGESVPRSVGIGEVVLAGTINQSGSLTVEVTKAFGESSIAKMLELVENASKNKAPTQKFITTFARYYTPIVVFLSLGVAILPPLFIPTTDRYTWVYRALMLLVISCPCGLVISIPLGYFGGIGAAAKRGILVKGSAYLDSLTQVKTVVFDKTGTLTNGTFEVTNISPSSEYTPDRLLELAAIIESQSSHPIAKSILAAYGQTIDRSRIRDYQEVAGFGIRAKIDDAIVIAGNAGLLAQAQIDCPQSKAMGTIVHLAVDRQYAGYISIADTIKPESQMAIAKLKEIGIEQMVMLTGDRHSIAAEIAQQLGLNEYRAELLPEGKLTALEEIIWQLKPKTRIAVVGDGINDAPILARADVGIAMGGLGSDSAIETADLVIMNDSPLKLVEAIEIALRTRQIVWQNIIFAIAVKGVFIILSIWGIATMWEAVFADVGVALMAIANATRVMR